jgi:hypothetical protein
MGKNIYSAAYASSTTHKRKWQDMEFGENGLFLSLT